VALPLLLAAFSIARPPPLPAPIVPPAFDETVARELAREFVAVSADRAPQTFGSIKAAEWAQSRLERFGLHTTTESFTARVPGEGRVTLRNVIAIVRGRSPTMIVVTAHRDNTGIGPGVNDNASGTAALLELARLYAIPGLGSEQRAIEHTLAFVSTDGGIYGGLGADWLASRWRERSRIVAVVNLHAIGGPGRARLEIAGDRPRSPAATLVSTAARRLLEETGAEPTHPSALGQLFDLAFPFSFYEQAPYVARGIPAITITSAGSRPPDPFTDRSLDTQTFASIGAAAQQLLASLDQGLELAQGTTSYVFLGDRMIRGWAIAIVLAGMLAPFLVSTVDLFARCRRRGIPLAPAFRSFRSRLAFWLFVAALVLAFAKLGAFPDGAPRPLGAHTAAAHEWSIAPITALVVLSIVSWIVARDRLLPRRAIAAEEELAGYTAALLALGVVALMVFATNPFALIIILPALHVWLWLPHVSGRHPLWRIGVLAAGFAGPAIFFWSFGTRFGFGFDTPWYLVELVTVGYVPLIVVPVAAAWAACGAQLAAVSVGRYAPYPAAHERPARGPLRKLARWAVLASRERRRRQAEARQRAVG
jgi:peptidase M28-like protein